MPIFRKKTPVVEAIQWDGTDESSDALLELGAEFSVKESLPPFLSIKTLHGRTGGRVGDWVVKSDDGQFHVYKPDAFAAEYEKA